MGEVSLLVIIINIIGVCVIGILRSVNPIYAILLLIIVYGSYSAILLTIELEFLACIYILVNVGAIAVLFLFIVMMLNINIVEMKETIKKYEIYMSLLILGLIGLILYLMFQNNLKIKEETLKNLDVLSLSDTLNIQNLKNMIEYKNYYTLFIETTDIQTMGSNLIYGTYSIWFIMACIMLLIGMVGVIYITEDLILEKKALNDRRRQNLNSQISREYRETIKNYNLELRGKKANNK